VLHSVRVVLHSVRVVLHSVRVVLHSVRVVLHSVFKWCWRCDGLPGHVIVISTACILGGCV
jgi:hypothetical protein